MSRTIPTNKLRILSGVPFAKGDNKTLSTKMFGNVTGQANYFLTKSIHQMEEITYIFETGAISVDTNSMNLIGANYIMFQNSDYSNKWIYAFIDRIEYENDITCSLYFTIDNKQTYLFDFQIKECMVEREHASTDVIGDNLVEDNLITTGMLYTDYFNWLGVSDDLMAVVVATFDKDGNDVQGEVYGGIYSACAYIPFNLEFQDEIDDLNAFIAKAVTDNKVDGIVDLFIMPSRFYTDQNAPVVEPVTIAKRYGNFQNYTPQNNKIYTYPYNYLIAQSTSGQQQELHFEKFLGTTCEFTTFGSNYSNSQIVLAPRGYNAHGDLINSTDLSYMITLEGFPHCAYNIDTFKAYIAQNGGSMAIQALTSAVTAGIGIATGNPFTAVGAVQTAGNVMGMGAEMATLAGKAPQMKGSTTVSALSANKLLDFSIRNVRLTREFAEKADKIWNMYGYPVYTVKTPNITNRPRYNFVKTANAIVLGNCPPDALLEMQNSLNSGFTFWHGDFVGDYSTLNK